MKTNPATKRLKGSTALLAAAIGVAGLVGAPAALAGATATAGMPSPCFWRCDPNPLPPRPVPFPFPMPTITVPTIDITGQ